jgi:two-component system sensor histidine kinase KdpD
LSTPLASIKASVTSLLQPDITWPEEERRDLLSAINEEADRLNQLVANLLDLSRIEAGELRPELDWYDLSETIYEAADRTELLLRGHRLRVDIPEALPALRFDFIEIIQVLVNLLDNAAKYSPPDTTISLVVRRMPNAVEVSVQDEGPGSPRGEEERIFDKFYRVEATNRTIGSGVGLAICRGIIEAHGGRIWAERNRDRGIAIRFILPDTEADRVDGVTRKEHVVPS